MKRNMLAFAISIVAQAFEEKLYNGRPYMLHCIRVMLDVDEDDDELQQIAALHDIVEDCRHIWDFGSLRSEGFSERVISAVDALTHRDGEYYDAYIKRVALNIDAVKVKRADLRDNSQITHIKGLTKADFERVEKYYLAYTYLSKI